MVITSYKEEGKQVLVLNYRAVDGDKGIDTACHNDIFKEWLVYVIDLISWEFWCNVKWSQWCFNDCDVYRRKVTKGIMWSRKIWSSEIE